MLNQAGREPWDAIVIGAGPGGCVASTLLSRSGFRVLLVERSAFPRDKVCGCCLSGKAVALLDELNLRSSIETSIPLDRFELATCGKSSILSTRGGAAISRATFDTRLSELATAEGVCFLDQTVATLLDEPESLPSEFRFVQLQKAGQSQVVQSRVVIIASGLGSTQVTTHLKLDEQVSRRGLIGLTTLLEDNHACVLHTIRMAVSKNGYVGLTRLEDNRLAVSAAVRSSSLKAMRSPGKLVSMILEDSGLLVPGDLANASWMGTRELTRRLSKPSSRRVFILGDAAGYLEPFTGQGMYWAMSSAVRVQSYASRAIQNWDDALTESWSRDLKQYLISQQRACRLVGTIMHRPIATRLTINLLHYAPWLALPFLYSIHGNAPLKRQLVP